MNPIDFVPVNLFGLITIYCLPHSAFCLMPLWLKYILEIAGFGILYLLGRLILWIMDKTDPGKKQKKA